MKLNKAKGKTKKLVQTLSLMNLISCFVGYGDTNIEQSKKNKSWVIRILFEGKICFLLGREVRKMKIH